jgi:hypothetical protein
MASHAGWTEYTNYSNATRIAISWSAASSGTKATTGTYTFNINGAGGSVYGAFVTSGSAISGTTGTLYSEGAFSTYRNVASGDSLVVSYSSTIT